MCVYSDLWAATFLFWVMYAPFAKMGGDKYCKGLSILKSVLLLYQMINQIHIKLHTAVNNVKLLFCVFCLFSVQWSIGLQEFVITLKTCMCTNTLCM